MNKFHASCEQCMACSDFSLLWMGRCISITHTVCTHWFLNVYSDTLLLTITLTMAMETVNNTQLENIYSYLDNVVLNSKSIQSCVGGNCVCKMHGILYH